MKINYEILRSQRRTVSLEITKDARVLVRAPQRMKFDDIDVFVRSHGAWIETHIQKARERMKGYDEADEAKLRKAAVSVIPQKVELWSHIMGLSPTGVRITGARTRFGSCSPANSLCFSFYLMQYPEQAIDYVVVHELAHIKEKNHGKRFYALVREYLPDYKERVQMLKK